ncbi:Auxilin-related protein 2 [Apostasia shenzhenica]|uniref:Auxilin-related protein 2 n=1 Tax=Apostasia shenzhenica TaxID=1088818 RepID=A0A2I0B2K2_9ASPA|nr:Auxilin-related protein 2 [Apostasia shenzhenica]
MEELHSSRRQRKKPHDAAAAAVARSDFDDIFGGPLRHWNASFPPRIEDYSEIFGGAASASSIPVLELPSVDDDCRGGVDYSEIFGRFDGGDFGFSYDELFEEEKAFGVSRSNMRTPGDVFSNQQANEVSELPVDGSLGNHVANPDMDQLSSIPKQSDDILLKTFNEPSQRTSQAITSASTAMVNAKDPAYEMESKIVNKMATSGTSTKGCEHDEEIEKEKPHSFSSNAKKHGLNQNAELRPPDSVSASLVPENEKHHSRSSSYHSTCSGDMVLSDVTFLDVSEISLQTKPMKEPPPSRPPPNLSMKTEDPKMRDSYSSADQEGMLPKPIVNCQLYSSSGATKSSANGDCNKVEHCFYDTEFDPSSAAAASAAAIKEAMEQAQARLKRAKEYMERKHDKFHRKAGHNKTRNGDVGKDDGIEVKAAQNLLKENIFVDECIFVRRESQRISYGNYQLQKTQENGSKSYEVTHELDESTGERKADELYHELFNNIRIGSTIHGIYRTENERNAKEAIIASQENENDSIVAEGAHKFQGKCKSSEVDCNVENLGSDASVNVLGISGMKGARENENSLKEASIGDRDKKNDTKVGEKAYESEEKLESSTVLNVQKPLNDINFKVSGVAGMGGREDVPDTVLEWFMLKDNAMKVEDNYDSTALDEHRELRDSRETSSSEEEANKTNAFCGSFCRENVKRPNSSDCRENEKRPETSNADHKFEVVNEYGKGTELNAAEESCRYVDENRTDFIISHPNCELNASNKNSEDVNETLFQGSFANEIRIFNDVLSSYDKLVEKELHENTAPCSNFGEETRSTIHRYSHDDAGQEIKGSSNSAKNNEGESLHLKEKARISAGNELKQDITRKSNEPENVLEKLQVRGTVDHANIEQILNSKIEDSLKEARDVHAKFEDNESSMRTTMNEELVHSDVLTAEERCGGSESMAQACVASELASNQSRSKAIDEAFLQGQNDDLDSLKVDLEKPEGSLPAHVQDTRHVSHAYPSGCQKHPGMNENEKLNHVEMWKDKEDAVKLEEEKNIERVKDDMSVERANHEACERAITESRLRAERIAVERVTAEARQRALEEAQEKAKKAAEFEKASREARLKAERLAVERATEEARQRAIKKALAEKASKEARDQAAQIKATCKDRIKKDNTSVHVKEDLNTRKKPSNDIPWNAQEQSATANIHRVSDSYHDGGNESTLRCKAIHEREQRTAERAAKALAEKNMRDILAQREQAERDRLAESLDTEVKRWSSCKDGNLRALLSTLHYILGPESGWQPIPLTDVITTAAVKKAYRKATLCVHPDKLQQRGAGIQQKYICEKVFDLLKPIPLTDVITTAAIKEVYRKATLCVHPDKLQQRGAGIQQKYICEKVFDLLQFLWGVGLPNDNGVVQRFPRAGWRLAFEWKGIRELGCMIHPSSKGENMMGAGQCDGGSLDVNSALIQAKGESLPLAIKLNFGEKEENTAPCTNDENIAGSLALISEENKKVYTNVIHRPIALQGETFSRLLQGTASSNSKKHDLTSPPPTRRDLVESVESLETLLPDVGLEDPTLANRATCEKSCSRWFKRLQKRLKKYDASSVEMQQQISRALNRNKFGDYSEAHLQSWVRRWCRNGRGRVRGASKPAAPSKSEAENSRIQPAKIKNKISSSIEAMALMGKSLNNYRPCSFQRKGASVLWTT